MGFHPKLSGPLMICVVSVFNLSTTPLCILWFWGSLIMSYSGTFVVCVFVSLCYELFLIQIKNLYS